MELQAKKRDILGKKTKALRREGLIPAELYGHGFENVHLTVSAKEFGKVFKEVGESSIVRLKIKNQKAKMEGERDESFDGAHFSISSSGSMEDKEKEGMPVLVHDVQMDPIEDMVTHIDFYAVRMDEKLHASIPLKFVGEAPAVKEQGGVLIKAIHELMVEALPINLPRDIEVSIDGLAEIGHSIHVKDISIDASKVKILVDSNTTVATIVVTKVEEVEVAPTPEEGVEAAPVEAATAATEEPKAK